MEFRILGPLEVADGDAVAALPGVKQRALLALLLLNANQVVSSDRLIEELWTGQPPESARAALQVRVSQLRKALGDGGAAIVTRPPGYLAQIGRDELDLHRFERLVGEADAVEPAVAAAKLREALALWRGPPLADIGYEAFAQNAIRRLEELRLAAVEKRIDTDLTLGRHADLIAELETLVGEHPLRERLRAQLMLALYRCGRQADALAAYQSARRVLVDELGIEPSPPLRDLEQAMLRQDSTLDLATATVHPGELSVEILPERTPSHRDAVPRQALTVVTVLLCDVTASTASGEALDPEALHAVMNRCFSEMRSVIEHHGGTVARFTGGALLAVFGVPARREDDAFRAVRASLEIRERLSRLSEELERGWGTTIETRTGINTGGVVTGDSHDEGIVVGDAVNLAARLERTATANQILIGRETYRLVGEQVEADPVDPVAKQGNVGAVEAYQLSGIRIDDTDGRGLSSPMVGRHGPLAALEAAFSDVLDHHVRRLMIVLGPAGIGKSRLTREFTARVGERACVLRGRCLSYGEGSTYGPVAEILRQAANIDESDPAELALEKLASIVPRGEDSSFVTERIGGVLGLTDDEGQKEETFWALRRVFESLAEVRPVVVAIDDMHWAQASLLDLIEYLGERVEGRLLLLVLARPEGQGRTLATMHAGRDDCECLSLEPLNAADSRILIGALIDDAQLADGLADRIAETAGGNPLFVQEVLRMLIDDGLLQRQEGRWTTAGTLESISVPATIEALLGARLDRLSDSERAVLERAAVVGRVFWREALAELSPPRDQPKLAFHLDALVAKDLITRDTSIWANDVAFRFQHVLVRDVAYNTMLKRSRSDLHARMADWLERNSGERGLELAELTGYHLERAYRLREGLGSAGMDATSLASRAAAYLGGAGRRAAARGDMPAAAGLLERACSLLPADIDERVELSLCWSGALLENGATSQAREVLTEAVSMAATADNQGLHFRALVDQAFLVGLTDPTTDLDAFARLAHDAIATFQELGDEAGLAKAWRLLSLSSATGERLTEATQVLERALCHAGRAQDRREADEILSWLMMSQFLGPARAEDAIPADQAFLDSAGDDPRADAALLILRGGFAAMAGDFVAARELCDRGMATLHDIGLELIRGVFSLIAGAIESWAGNEKAAETHWQTGFRSQLEMGGTAWLTIPTFAAWLSRCMLAQGRDREAARYARILKSAGRDDDVRKQVDSRTIEGLLLARQGRLEEAEEIMRNGLELVRASDSSNLRGDTALALAELLVTREKRDEAVHLARDAQGEYKAKGNKVDYARASALLERLDRR